MPTVLKRAFPAVLDQEEKGYPPILSQSPEGQEIGNSGHEALRIPLQSHSLIPANDKLLIFRALTGIDGVPALITHGFFHRRSAPNMGIYARVLRYEQRSSFRYRVFSILINTCLAVQIIVASALTAIGAASASHKLVTAFGAINTIMAAILTYLKASGVADQEKDLEHVWRDIREHMEQREREFCLQDCQLDVEEEVAAVERMYREARARMGNSVSDGYHQGGGEHGFNKPGLLSKVSVSLKPPTRAHIQDEVNSSRPAPLQDIMETEELI
ncbi:hypothetical protein PABG_00647 [Paracoccidioides brasiliensis Pb03]|uniref:SMODS and SLOG-associating 2TM effector domain-containing protein n=2 Tax=Paracoccidioides brasiliensis TaxID=121759 RepID=C1G7C7_PARBD|nr:uncharacterized protein PADG_03082 [Paracoccidioides brasiliensis Pb18]EEH18084.1 hypothetical protein PABG_00647 [Paracoccidioides brasiliensis Pb03]EEH46984.1 hypothetical protein PADG_03082 [Paracoccidioides brasiliensis Pb18]ODH46967.1 hypothetical protein GX48_06956 [Paracoccidioides brasiliensis]